MKKIALLIVSLLSLFYLHSQTPIPEGNVSGTWSSDGSPYLIEGEITIPVGEQLIIEPGVEVNFQGYFKFNINGTLMAVGDAQDSILFTTDDPETGWHGIRIVDTETNGQDTTKIMFCRVEYGKSTGTCPDNCGGGIFASHARPYISNNTIQYNSAFIGAADWGGGGIYSEYSNPTITDNIIQNNHSGHDGGGIYCSYGSPLISNNIIRNNDASFRGGGIASFLFATPQIRGNIIENNTCESLGGGLYISGGEALVVHNYIINNSGSTGGGIGVYLNNSKIINNLIRGNQGNLGGGIYNKGSSPWVYNNTITENEAFINGGGIYNTFEFISILFNSNPLIVNCIIHSNDAPDGFSIGSLNDCTPVVSYSLIEDLSGAGIEGLMNDLGYNIESDPLFDLEGEYPYALMSASPCIDAGKEDLTNMQIPETDLANRIRVWDGNGDQSALIDMGAYEYGSTGSGFKDQTQFINSYFTLSPNPAKNIIEIALNQKIISESVEIIIFSVDGRVLKKIKQLLNHKNQKISIDISKLGPGAYIVQCLAEKSSLGSQKFLKQ